MAGNMKRLLSLILILLPSLAYSQGPSSAQIEAAKGIVKLFTTAGLPATCAPGQRIWDTTANATKVCANDGVTWSSISFTGGAITTPILAPNGSAAAPAYSYSAYPGLGMYASTSSNVCLTAWGGGCNLSWDGNYGLLVGYGQPISFTGGAASAGVYGDVQLWRGAANTLAQRNGTSAQAFNWYYSYTDASNYQRGALKTSATGIEIAAETAGSGADNLNITLTPAGTGKVVVPSGGLTVTGDAILADSVYPRALALTDGTMTNAVGPGYATLTQATSSFLWTNAQVVALGAALTGDIKVATLPAKTQVVDAEVVITGAAAGTTTLTVACGRVSAGYIDYIVASDAQAAANTVYGDASGERGTNLTGYDLPSYTGTTDVYCHFISTGANLDQVTGSTGRVILTTRLLP